jgi:hypothetical protein
MSTRSSYFPSSIAVITSGAIQYGVPIKELAGHEIDAEPKSALKNTEIQLKQSNRIYNMNITIVQSMPLALTSLSAVSKVFSTDTH